MAGAFDWLDTGDTAAPADQGGTPVGSSLSDALGRAVDIAGQVAVIKATKGAVADQTPAAATSPIQVSGSGITVSPALLVVGAVLIVGAILLLRRKG